MFISINIIVMDLSRVFWVYDFIDGEQLYMMYTFGFLSLAVSAGFALALVMSFKPSGLSDNIVKLLISVLIASVLCSLYISSFYLCEIINLDISFQFRSVASLVLEISRFVVIILLMHGYVRDGLYGYYHKVRQIFMLLLLQYIVVLITGDYIFELLAIIHVYFMYCIYNIYQGNSYNY